MTAILTVKEVMKCNRYCYFTIPTLLFCSLYHQNTICFHPSIFFESSFTDFTARFESRTFSVFPMLFRRLRSAGPRFIESVFAFSTPPPFVSISTDGLVIDYQRSADYLVILATLFVFLSLRVHASLRHHQTLGNARSISFRSRRTHYRHRTSVELYLFSPLPTYGPSFLIVSRYHYFQVGQNLSRLTTPYTVGEGIYEMSKNQAYFIYILICRSHLCW